MNYKKAGEISSWLFVFAAAAIGGTFFLKGWTQSILFLAGIALIIAGVVVRIVFWRCPHCKKRLKLGFRQEPTKCPNCGGDLLNKKESNE
jgi:DNA-directed RNA polymerase subunit RPC12/RpoP